MPEELVGDKLTNRIAVQPTSDEAQPEPKKTAPKVRSASTTTGLAMDRGRAQQSSVVTSSTQGVPPRGAGQGGRVRGRVDGKIVSSKVRLLYDFEHTSCLLHS